MPQSVEIQSVEIESRARVAAKPRVRVILQTFPKGQFFKLPTFLKLTSTDPFAAWFVVTGDATLDGIRGKMLLESGQHHQFMNNYFADM